jgi:hypothetical protein
LAELGVAHLGFDDRVDEVQGKRVVLHLHGVEVVQSEFRNPLNCNRELAAEVGLFSFEVNSFV